MDEDYKRPWQVLDVQTGISYSLAEYVSRTTKKLRDRDDAELSVPAEASQPPAPQTAKARSQMTETTGRKRSKVESRRRAVGSRRHNSQLSEHVASRAP